jgi:hypothetical protein
MRPLFSDRQQKSHFFRGGLIKTKKLFTVVSVGVRGGLLTLFKLS